MATRVTVRGGNLDQALRKFKQKVARDGVPSEFKKIGRASCRERV